MRVTTPVRAPLRAGQPCPIGQIGLDGADDDGQTATERVGVTGEEQTQRPGKAQHPLAYRYFRGDVVNEVGRRFEDWVTTLVPQRPFVSRMTAIVGASMHAVMSP